MLPILRATALLIGAHISAFAQGGQVGPQAPPMPDGPARSLVTTQCGSCHMLDMALSKRDTTDGWRVTVQAMVERGAKITSQDAGAIASYLGEHYGPAAPPAPARQASALPAGPGRDVLTKKCFQCHQIGMWTALRQDRAAWEGVLYRMVGRGALWTEDEIHTMAGYLANIRGPQ